MSGEYYCHNMGFNLFLFVQILCIKCHTIVKPVRLFLWVFLFLNDVIQIWYKKKYIQREDYIYSQVSTHLWFTYIHTFLNIVSSCGVHTFLGFFFKHVIQRDCKLFKTNRYDTHTTKWPYCSSFFYYIFLWCVCGYIYIWFWCLIV